MIHIPPPINCDSIEGGDVYHDPEYDFGEGLEKKSKFFVVLKNSGEHKMLISLSTSNPSGRLYEEKDCLFIEENVYEFFKKDTWFSIHSSNIREKSFDFFTNEKLCHVGSLTNNHIKELLRKISESDKIPSGVKSEILGISSWD